MLSARTFALRLRQVLHALLLIVDLDTAGEMPSLIEPVEGGRAGVSVEGGCFGVIDLLAGNVGVTRFLSGRVARKSRVS